MMSWNATESEAWGLLTYSRKNSVSGTQVETTAAHSPWQKGRVEQRIAPIKEVEGKTILQHDVAGRSAMSVVSYEVAHALNQRASRLGILPATRVFHQRLKVCGELVEHEEVVPHPKVVDEGDELARRFIRVSARELWKNMLLQSDQEQLLRVPGNVRARYPLFLHRQNESKRADTGTRGLDWTTRSK